MFFLGEFFEGGDIFGESVEGCLLLCDFCGVVDCELCGGEGRDSAGGAAFAHGLGAEENAGEGVVVGRWDGVELVIVAAGAAKGHAEKGAPDGVDLFIDELHPKEFVILEFVVESSEDEVAAANELVVSLFDRIVFEDVSGEVLENELVVGLVLVEGVDDVVAEAPGIGEDEAASATAGFRVAGDIEPMPPPTFSELGTGEEVIDDVFEGGGGVVGEEGPHLFRRRRKPDEVVVNSA